MKVLYVMPLVLGLEDILKGDKEAKGLPSLMLPIEKLLEQKHDVDVILISDYQGEYHIRDPKLKSMIILANINNDLVRVKKIKKVFRLIKSGIQEFRAVCSALKSNSYDVVFCHGTAAVIGNIVANVKRVPCVYRLYGTVGLFSDLCKYRGVIGIIRNPIYYVIFKLQKYCIIGTDEGSHTDRVYDLWKPKRNPYPFYHWLNGVDIQNIDEIKNTSYEIPGTSYLFMAGRVTDVKNQAYAIRILHDLDKKGIRIDLYFAGHIDDRYYPKLQKMISEYKLDGQVHFMGPIPRDYLKLMGYHAKACIICDDFCQNGNVFYELYSTGSIIVSVDDGSLDRFVSKGKSAFLAKNITGAVECVIQAINLSDRSREEMRKIAIKKSTETLSTWDERVEKEIDILKKACRKNGY